MATEYFENEILIVEDNDFDFRFMMKSFKKSGYSACVTRVTTGDDALDYLFNEGNFSDKEAYPIPFMILLDLGLPGVDGDEVLCKVKSDELLKNITVIIMTSIKTEHFIEKCYALGADGYVMKPVTAEGLTEAIRNINGDSC
ncbi:MAG: response regulator [Candidatus Nitrohelix vancouverensis]|uniref:Response regulator n=1 Tax=Candidatus Nitrohelix vancouverensis TaxID=2705534 RepID=A0A7T0C420_9BACT|nr:MAG: response regulator [Candidatus Nitrohelix vancouverensis]